MIALKNVKFYIKQKHMPEYYLGLWAAYTANCIKVPDYIYKSLYKHSELDNSVALYLIGWFYKYNEEHLNLPNIEKIIVQGWDETSISK